MKKQIFYYDGNFIKFELMGVYYKDLLGEIMQKYGKWLYYDKVGVIIEECNYYCDKFNGVVKVWYFNGKFKEEGYFWNDIQDSVFKFWYEIGNLE